MMPDIEKYRHYVDQFDLTESQKTELILIGWSISQNFVDRAFGDDPVQVALTGRADKRALKPGLVIEFKKAIDGTFSVSDINPEREEK